MMNVGTVKVPVYAKVDGKEIHVGEIEYDVVAEERDGQIELKAAMQKVFN